MRHLADQPPDRVARQARVRVQRENISDVLRRRRCGDPEIHESGVRRAAQQPIQFVKLAALAFPTDPSPFAVVPNAPAVQQEKTRARRGRTVTSVKAVYAFAGASEQLRVAVHMLGVGVDPIRKQGEVQIALRTRQMMDLEPLHLRRDILPRGQEGRHYDQCAQRFRNPVT